MAEDVVAFGNALPWISPSLRKTPLPRIPRTLAGGPAAAISQKKGGLRYTTFTDYSIRVMLLESLYVEFTNEFGAWWETISSKAQAAVDAYITMLEERGPTLSHPYSSKVVGSRHAHMRELRAADRLYDEHLEELEADPNRGN